VAPPRKATDRRWDLLLACIAIYILMAVGRFHQLFPFVNLVRPAVLFGATAILLFMMDSRADRKVRLVLITPMRFLLAFAGWMMLSMVGALVLTNSFNLVIDNFLKTVIMSIVVACAVRGVRDVERLTLVYFASVTIYSVVVIARFSAVDEDGRMGDLYYYDANDFATLVATALPLGLYFLHRARHFSGWLLALASLAVLTLAFVRSGSRGGFVAAIAVGIFVVLRYRAIPLRWRIGVTALVTLIVLGAAGAQYWSRMGTILSDEDYNRTHDSGRFKIWERGVGYMLRFPVLGVGPANFATAEGTLSDMAERAQYGVGVRWNAAHNSYVQVGAETGVPGLVMYLAMILTTFGALRAVTRRATGPANRHLRELASALTASVIGFAVGAFFLSLAYQEMFFTLLALGVGLHKIARININQEHQEHGAT